MTTIPLGEGEFLYEFWPGTPVPARRDGGTGKEQTRDRTIPCYAGRPGVISRHAFLPPNAILRDPVAVAPGVAIPDYAILRGPRLDITKQTQVLVLGPIGSMHGYLTALFAEDGVWVNRGCFCGPLEVFRCEAREKAERHREIYLGLADWLEAIWPWRR